MPHTKCNTTDAILHGAYVHYAAGRRARLERRGDGAKSLSSCDACDACDDGTDGGQPLSDAAAKSAAASARLVAPVAGGDSGVARAPSAPAARQPTAVGVRHACGAWPSSSSLSGTNTHSTAPSAETSGALLLDGRRALAVGLDGRLDAAGLAEPVPPPASELASDGAGLAARRRAISISLAKSC